MTALKQEFLRKLKQDARNYAFNSALYGEFYIDADDPEQSWVSPELLKALGHSTSKAKDAHHLKKLLHPDDEVIFDARVADTFKNGSASWSMQVRAVKADRSIVTAMIKAQLVARQDDQRAVMLHGIVVPLEHDAGFTNSESHREKPPVSYSRILLEAIPDLLFVFNQQGIFLDYKPGKQAEDFIILDDTLLGQGISDALPDFLAAQMMLNIDALGSGKHVQPFEYVLEYAGHTAHYHCHMSSLGGDVFLAVIQNITGQRQKDELLREAFERRRIFVEQAPNAMAMLDKDLRYLAVSNQWMEDYNFHGRQIIGESHFKIFSNLGMKWRAMMDNAIRGVSSSGADEPYTREDGLAMWLKWDIRPWYIGENEVGGVIMLTEDVTERKRIEEENRRLSQLQQLMMRISATYINLPVQDLDEAINGTLSELGQNVSADRIYVFEYDWINRISNNTHEWCGEGIESQLEDLQGLLVDLVPEWTETHQAGREIYIPDVAALPPGNIKDILTPQHIKSLLTIPMINEGQCIGFVGFDSVLHTSSFPDMEREMLTLFADMLVNVQMRMKAQRELDFTQSQLQGILLEMNDVVWSLGIPDLETVFISPSIEKLTGENAEECAKSPFWWQQFIHPDDMHITTSMIEDLKASKRYASEHRIIARSGVVKWVSTRGRVIRNSAGKAIRIDAMISDITDRKQFEAQIQDLLHNANDQNERLQNFAHIVAHNLRSHAANFEMLLQLWGEEQNPDQQAIFFENLCLASQNLNATIGHLNEVIQCTTSTEEAMKPVSLHEAMSHAVGTLQAVVRDTQTTIAVDVPEGSQVLGVPAYIDSIVLNLLTNAIKYRHADRLPHIAVKAIQSEQGWLVTVVDNGQGIDLKRHGKKLFGFHQTFHGNADARGLGLFITRNQVSSMGGRITVDSTPGEGTTFSLWFKPGS